MVKKILLIGAMLLMAIVILGCTAQDAGETTQTTETAQEKETGAGTPVETVQQEAPVYQAPLSKDKMTRNCETDDDCMLVRVMTGAGEIQECIGSESEYEGETSERCHCKYLSSTKQVLSNGTELTMDNYECRHIA